MDRANSSRVDAAGPVWEASDLANRSALKKRQDKAHGAKEGTLKILDFGPSPYIKNGWFETAKGEDYLNACKEKPVPSAQEESLRPPKTVQVASSFKTFDLLKSKVPFDATKQTVVVLDDFKSSSYAPNGAKKPGLSHGEISAAGAEQAGLNVLRLQMTTDDLLPTVLSEIDREAKAGNLPLKPGDAINISYGHHWSIKETRCLLDMPSLTPGSYASQRTEIIKRIEEVATGTRPARAAADGKWLTMVAATEKEVAHLEQSGITLVVSAGNEGPNHLNLDFINASVQLAAGNSKGQAFPYSALNSLTKTYPSSFELAYDASKKAYRLGNSGVYFSEKDFGGPPHPKSCLRANKDGESSSFRRRPKTALKDCPVAVIEGTSFANVEFWQAFKKHLDE